MSYNAKAIGSGSEGAQTELQDNYHKVSPQTVWPAKYMMATYDDINDGMTFSQSL